MNTQVVSDSISRIIDIVAKWPGSTHDSRILTESALTAFFLYSKTTFMFTLTYWATVVIRQNGGS